MSAVSRKVTPSSSARWIVAIASPSSVRPVELGHAHAAEPERRDLEPLGAQHARLHPPTLAGASIDRVSVASPEQYLANLNPAQREAVLHTEGPLLVIAGAGSGKTRVLTHRVAHLISAIGVKPNEILAITFTNKAAGEMRERLTTMLGPMARAIWILTFHAACGRILRSEAERLGYRSNFTIYDCADQVRLVKQCLEELEKDPKRFVPRGVHAQISNAKNQLITPADVRRADRLLLRPDGRRGVRALPEASWPPRTRSTSTTC